LVSSSDREFVSVFLHELVVVEHGDSDTSLSMACVSERNAEYVPPCVDLGLVIGDKPTQRSALEQKLQPISTVIFSLKHIGLS
jgi:hypothetical protein